jgi:hypothetical protein
MGLRFSYIPVYLANFMSLTFLIRNYSDPDRDAYKTIMDPGWGSHPHSVAKKVFLRTDPDPEHLIVLCTVILISFAIQILHIFPRHI